MPLPYNTGKVSIGSLYEPVKCYSMSRDAERLQVTLIGKGVKNRSNPIAAVAIVCVAVACMFVIVVMGG